MSQQWSRRWLPIAALALVAASVFLGLSSCHHATSPVSAPRTSGVQPTAQPSTGPGPTTSPVTFSGVDNAVTLDGKARSVETTASVTGLRSLHVLGSPVLTVQGEFVDRAGVHHGPGTVTAQGSDLTVTADDIQLATRLRVQPGAATVNPGTNPASALAVHEPMTITAGRITFQPPAPPATPGTTTTAPPPVTLAGPVVATAPSAGLSGSQLRWADVPVDLQLTSSEADLSWAGSGSITTSARPLQAGYLGVRAQQLQATLHRAAGGVDVHGTGLALQVFADGVPQMRTPARIDVLGTHATTGFLGRRHAFVWTPRNLGSVCDMAILSIHPGNAAASGVHVGLLPMPAMFGGEPHALVGGDTNGLKGANAIDSLIARNGDDKRSIGYDAAPGVQLVLVVQGNFDTITVTVPTY